MENQQLREWRKAEFGSQQALSEKIGRGQNMISRYERGEVAIEPEVAQKLRELGYKGPLSTSTETPKTLAEVDAGLFYEEAEDVVRGIEEKGGSPIPGDKRKRLVGLAVTEIQRSHALGRPETARDLIERWWAMTGGNPQ